MSRLWDKGVPLDERVLAYTAGEDHALDDRLVAHDVRASIAHAGLLRACGLLSDADCAAVCAGLEALAGEHARGLWRVELADEDVHTALERRLTARLGDTGGRVHLGRSRNDQLLTALRLYLLDAGSELHKAALGVADALTALGQRETDTALPGYTHMQQAMPSSVHLWADGFAAEIRDYAEGLAAARRRAAKSPLGSAAGYGVPGLPIDQGLCTHRGADMRIGVAKQVDPPRTDGIDIAFALHVFQPHALTTADRQQGQPLMIFHLRGGMPQHGEVTLPDCFVFSQTRVPFLVRPLQSGIMGSHGQACKLRAMPTQELLSKCQNHYDRNPHERISGGCLAGRKIRTRTDPVLLQR